MTVIESSRIREVKEDCVILENKAFQEQIIPCDDVVTCYVRSNQKLYHEMLDAGITAFNIGDSSIPANLSHAVHDAGEFVLNLSDEFIVNPNGCVIKEVPLEVREMLSE